MSENRSFVVCYSRTGTTLKMAEAISEKLSSGRAGYFGSTCTRGEKCEI